MHRWLVGLLAVAAVAVLAAGCDSAPELTAIGVSRDDHGLRVHYVLCPGQSVESVTVRTSTSNPDDDETLWTIEATDSSPAAPPWEIGTVPEGFRAVVELTGDLPRDRRLVADIVTNLGSTSMGFSVAELDMDVVTPWSGDGLRPQDFVQRAEARCR